MKQVDWHRKDCGVSCYNSVVPKLREFLIEHEVPTTLTNVNLGWVIAFRELAVQNMGMRRTIIDEETATARSGNSMVGTLPRCTTIAITTNNFWCVGSARATNEQGKVADCKRASFRISQRVPSGMEYVLISYNT